MNQLFASFIVGCLMLFLVPAVNAADLKQVTFVVHCYDVGAQALEQQPGVVSVQRGWLGGREVDRVSYDAEVVNQAQLEQWLKAADSYVETIQEEASELK